MGKATTHSTVNADLNAVTNTDTNTVINKNPRTPAFDGMLIRAKLAAPAVPHHYIQRPELCSKISGADHKAVIVVAPVGSGKTSLLTACYAQIQTSTDISASWLNLDKADNDPKRLWSHIVAAITGMLKCQALEVSALLSMIDEIPKLTIGLSNILYEQADPLKRHLLFIDNIDQIPEQVFEEIICFVKDLLPRNFCFVFAGFSYPVSLDWFRLRDDVLDISPLMLVFDKEEAREYLRQFGITQVTEKQIGALLQLTDGWITGIKLSADYATSLPGGSGDNLDVTHSNPLHDLFFKKWVRSNLSIQTESFLLETCFLELFNPSLCDTVTGNTDSLKILEELCANNLFVFRVHYSKYGEGQWYRMQPLLKQIIQDCAKSLNPDYQRELNFRASAWYEKHGMEALAARHLLLATDHELVVNLTAATLPSCAILKHDLLQWVLDRPSSSAHIDPVCAMLLAWTYLIGGRAKEARSWFECAREQENEEIVSFAADSFTIKCTELEGDFAYAITQIEDIYARADEDVNPWLHSTLQLTLAESFEELGRLDEASGQYLRSEAIAVYAKSEFTQYMCRYLYGSLQLEMGKTKQVKKACFTALKTCSQDSPLFGALRVLLAKSQLENNELDDAEVSLRRAMKRLSEDRNIEFYLEAYVTKAKLLIAQEQLEAAYEEIVRAQMLGEGAFRLHGSFINVLLTSGLIALMRDSLIEARQIEIRLSGLLNANDTVHYLRFLLLRARLLARCGETAEASVLAAEVSKQAAANNLIDINICSLLIESHLFSVTGQKGKALKLLGEALTLGAACDYVVTFVNNRGYIHSLLLEVLQQRQTTSATRRHATQLLTLFEKHDALKEQEVLQINAAATVELEALTEREKEILTALSSGMSRNEIADSLCVSLNTVKTHLKNIFCKLGVKNKAGALALLNEIQTN